MGSSHRETHSDLLSFLQSIRPKSPQLSSRTLIWRLRKLPRHQIHPHPARSSTYEKQIMSPSSSPAHRSVRRFLSRNRTTPPSHVNRKRPLSLVLSDGRSGGRADGRSSRIDVTKRGKAAAKFLFPRARGSFSVSARVSRGDSDLTSRPRRWPVVSTFGDTARQSFVTDYQNPPTKLRD